MYKVKDYLVHRTAGVCVVKDIIEQDFGFGLFSYYVLEPYFALPEVASNNQIMVRVDNDKQIREPVKKSVALDIISQIDSLESLWINDSKHRKELFTKIISECNLLSLCQLIKTVYMKKIEYIELKKNVPITDNTLCSNAEKLVYEEFAIALNKTPKEISELLQTKFKN